ncbi:metallophosphoesterase family protein [Mesorhizobium sp. J18]|uniref:metallophosphoesterase family protein n=1 Tax=Mesorhizobium sp. J18 TaxID=935263 RepID=UPI001FEEA165|nr:metallophosphoesterase family protein [Mesorhizobium sp. J18]
MAIYAVGDVHGCLDQLLSLERKILADAAEIPGPKLIIMLGDYIDRGPASAQVIDHLAAEPPEGFDRICLAGNHEVMMLDYLERRESRARWLSLGADATLASYGIDHRRLRELYRNGEGIDEMIRETVPAAHAAFLRSLPVLVSAPGFLFVHAGIRPGVELADQKDEDLVSIRSEFYAKAHLIDRLVVHGHTPVERPMLEGKRLNIDTGAYFSGRLTAVRFWQCQARILMT